MASCVPTHPTLPCCEQAGETEHREVLRCRATKGHCYVLGDFVPIQYASGFLPNSLLVGNHFCAIPALRYRTKVQTVEEIALQFLQCSRDIIHGPGHVPSAPQLSSTESPRPSHSGGTSVVVGVSASDSMGLSVESGSVTRTFLVKKSQGSGF